METATLTIDLPREDLDFAERYARRHRMTLAELIDRHLRHLRSQNDRGQELPKTVEEPREGLATLLGRWDDGDELADEVDRIVASRGGGTRPMADFEA